MYQEDMKEKYAHLKTKLAKYIGDEVCCLITMYMLFTGWEVRIMKNCDRGPRAAFSSPRSQFFTLRTDPKPVNNFIIFFFQALKRKKTHGKKKLTQALL